jgi:hypothetical protein
LESELTEIGTLAMRVVSSISPSGDEAKTSWNLEFDVRSGASNDGANNTPVGIAEIVDSDQIARSFAALDRIFGESPNASPNDAYQLVSDAIGVSRKQWPVSLLRKLWGYLHEHSESRKRSPETESRWLNLLGWSLRPGFGFPADDWRVQQTWRSVHNKLMHRSSAGISESIILWRRIAGGFTAGQQNALYQDAWSRIKPMFSGGGNPLNTNVAVELLRLLGSLERLANTEKTQLAESCLQSLSKKKMEPLRPAMLWTIGRLGCRVPIYASLHQTVPSERVSSWIERLIAIDGGWIQKESTAYSLVLMLLARKTGDRYRDVPNVIREKALTRLRSIGAPELHIELVEQIGQLDEENASQIVGDAIPLGFSLRT